MKKPSADRITAEATALADLAKQLVVQRARATKKPGRGASAKALGKIAARLESVRLIMSAAVEDLSALTQEG
jgi:hypothetical protein